MAFNPNPKCKVHVDVCWNIFWQERELVSSPIAAAVLWVGLTRFSHLDCCGFFPMVAGDTCISVTVWKKLVLLAGFWPSRHSVRVRIGVVWGGGGGEEEEHLGGGGGAILTR